MDQQQYDIVTLKPKWSVIDLFIEPSEAANKDRILHQLTDKYLSKGWVLMDDIIWGKDYEYAVMKIGRPSRN
ncbi:MAG: hypothetical protein AMJ56_09465 [Anaerolineae bacterium SG8_19]|jgi:hypothetical protein|nr:MAG: hypothetical protein AMJ56_09465 [Anaerolineae bacterium SG8_19]